METKENLYLPNNWEKVLRLLTNLWTPFVILGRTNKKPEGFFIFTSEVLFSLSSLPKKINKYITQPCLIERNKKQTKGTWKQENYMGKRKSLILLATLGFTSLSSRIWVVEMDVLVATLEREAQPEKKGRATNFPMALMLWRREKVEVVKWRMLRSKW